MFKENFACANAVLERPHPQPHDHSIRKVAGDRGHDRGGDQMVPNHRATLPLGTLLVTGSESPHLPTAGSAPQVLVPDSVLSHGPLSAELEPGRSHLLPECLVQRCI